MVFVVHPWSDAIDLAGAVRTHGAVLLRGWEMDVPAFARLAGTLGEVRTDLACSAGPRTEVHPGVFTANDAPPEAHIPVHHEMAQCPSPPAYVLFFCETPPAGGAAPILPSSVLLAELADRFPDVHARLRTDGARYRRTYPARTDGASPLGKAWCDAFGAPTRAAVERACAATGTACAWDAEDGSLRTLGPVVYPVTGDALFLAAETSLGGAPGKELVAADGKEEDAALAHALRHLGAFAQRACERVPWRAGDVLVLDNRTTMHGRDPFVPPRRILVALVGTLFS